MATFQMNCIDNRMREITKLNDNFSEVKNIPPLLICNQNNKERELLNRKNIENSVLLKNTIIPDLKNTKNYNDKIYERNIPTGKNIPINIDLRPLPSSYCLDKKFEEDQKGLEKYNKYVPNYACDTDVFLPNKGTVENYFNNIDLDSELKNINEIDTKCSKKLFKINPEDKNTKLQCYKDNLTNNYQELNCENGYTWCNYNKCSKLEEFPVCKTKEFKCDVKKESQRKINFLKSKKEFSRKLKEQKEKDDNQLQREKMEDYKKTIDMLNKKMVLNTHIEKDIEISSNKDLKPYNIIQYNNNQDKNAKNYVSNIYAPIVNKREFVTNNIEDIGYRKGLEKSIDMKIDKNLDYYNNIENKIIEKKEEEKINQYKLLNAFCPDIEGLYIDRYYQDTRTNLYDIDCRGQTRRLYNFNKSNKNNKDCINCEQLFNNQTKRKTINVNNIPYHIFN